MGAWLIALIYFSVYSLLHSIDAGLNYGSFSESAATLFYVDRGFLTYLFEPINIMIVFVSTAMIYRMEGDHKKTASLVESGWMVLLCTPFVFMGMKSFSTINSFIVYFGYESSLLGSLFFVNSENQSVIIYFITLAIIFSIPASIYVRKRYSFRI